MREIEFRGKISDCANNVKIGDWLCGDIYHNADGYIGITAPHDGSLSWCGLVDENTLGQFSGIYDTNGKKVYEGDVVIEVGYQEGTDFNKQYGLGRIGEIRYQEDLMEWNVGGHIGNDLHFENQKYKLEIIGNIYDNPELLEKEE